MLPAHLQSRKRNDNGPPSPRGGAFPHGDIPLALTGVVCRSDTLSRGERGSLHYTIYRPRHMKYNPPLICVTGGPGLPCQYLSPLVHLVNDRALILYDQVGCGQSLSTASHKEVFDLTRMVEDLAALVAALDCEEFHLLGHSFGGFLVYEYCCLHQPSAATSDAAGPKKRCLSVTLASTPVSVKLVEESCQKLQEQIREKMDDDGTTTVGELFSQRHECRIQPLPLQLHQSFESAGVSSTSKGFQLVREYDARQSQRLLDIPALILRGQHDFVTLDACQGWTEVFPADSSEMMTLAGCAHYGMLENEDIFGSALSSFLRAHEPPPKPLIFAKRPS